MDDAFKDHSTTGIKVRADHQNMLNLFHNPDVIADGYDYCCLLLVQQKIFTQLTLVLETAPRMFLIG